jgi:hypothetical protein
MRLVSSLQYAFAPGGGRDLTELYFRDNDLQSGFLQLKAFSPRVFNQLSSSPGSVALTSTQAESTEPDVPFEAVPIEQFEATNLPFQRAFLCQSPAYTPTTSDALIPVFQRYIDFDESSDPFPGTVRASQTDRRSDRSCP